MIGLFCTVFLLNGACADDIYRVVPVQDADFYRATWDGQTQDYPEPEFPFGCWVGTARVVAVNAAGESPEPHYVIWASLQGPTIEFDATACLTACEALQGDICTEVSPVSATCWAPLCGGAP